MAASLRPLLIGVLAVGGANLLEKLREGRLRMAMYARNEGFSLLEIFEVIGANDSVYDRLTHLTGHCEAAAILICGAQVDRSRVNWIAASAGMRVVELPPEPPVFAPPGQAPPMRRGAS